MKNFIQPSFVKLKSIQKGCCLERIPATPSDGTSIRTTFPSSNLHASDDWAGGWGTGCGGGSRHQASDAASSVVSGCWILHSVCTAHPAHSSVLRKANTNIQTGAELVMTSDNVLVESVAVSGRRKKSVPACEPTRSHW
jgi:hypothetical protein